MNSDYRINWHFVLDKLRLSKSSTQEWNIVGCLTEISRDGVEVKRPFVGDDIEPSPLCRLAPECTFTALTGDCAGSYWHTVLIWCCCYLLLSPKLYVVDVAMTHGIVGEAAHVLRNTTRRRTWLKPECVHTVVKAITSTFVLNAIIFCYNLAIDWWS